MRLTTSEFYSLTPKQFHLLWDRHREHLLHTELIQAYTTAAIVNCSMAAPEKPIRETSFMPSYDPDEGASRAAQSAEKYTDDEMSDFNSQVANMVAHMKRYNTTGKPDDFLINKGLLSDAD